MMTPAPTAMEAMLEAVQTEAMEETVETAEIPDMAEMEALLDRTELLDLVLTSWSNGLSVPENITEIEEGVQAHI